MKKLSFILCSAIVLAFLLISCKPKVDVAKEKEAIIAAINGENQSFSNKDIEKFKGFYIQDESQARMQIHCHNYAFHNGWKSLNAWVDSIPIFWTGVENYKCSYDFLAIKVMGDAAWAIFKSTQSWDYNKVPDSWNGILTMVLQKQDAKWKISCFSISDNTPAPPPPVPLVPPVPPAPPKKK